MTKKKPIVNCNHRKIVAISVNDIQCCDCGKVMGKFEWKELTKKVVENENKWLLQEDVCKHTRVGTDDCGIFCIDCNQALEFNEWLLNREPYNLLRDVYDEYSKTELANLVIQLREKLEEAHHILEVDHHFIFRDSKFAKEQGIPQDDEIDWLVQENVPLEKRDMEINGIFCRDTTNAIIKKDNKDLNKLLAEAISHLAELGVDTSKYEEYDDD